MTEELVKVGSPKIVRSRLPTQIWIPERQCAGASDKRSVHNHGNITGKYKVGTYSGFLGIFRPGPTIPISCHSQICI